jgi:hypothetical protein
MKHHLCIYDEYITFDGDLIPYGGKDIEEKITEVISEIFDVIVPKIGDGQVVVCGKGDARRILGRKLEDRLGKEVIYE